MHRVVTIVGVVVILLACAAGSAHLECVSRRGAEAKGVVLSEMRRAQARLMARCAFGYWGLGALIGWMVGRQVGVTAGLFSAFGYSVFGFAAYIVGALVLLLRQQKKESGAAAR